MTPLEAARRLAECEPYSPPLLSADGSICAFCGGDADDGRHWVEGKGWIDGPHCDDCPWLALPKIIAALEAAERLSSETGPVAFAIPPRVLCRVCDSEGSDWTHTARCPWAALREALDA
jgi:hypothetical protein